MGIGVGVFDPNCVDPNNWNGLNLLGEVVTKVRDKLISDGYQEKPLFVTTGYIRTHIEKICVNT